MPARTAFADDALQGAGTLRIDRADVPNGPPETIMIRFLFRAIAFIAFAIAVMFVVIDATRSIGVSRIVFTPFGESLQLTMPAALQALQDWLARSAPAFVSDPVLASVLALPTFAVFAVLALLFYALGRRPAPRGVKRPPH